MAPRLDVLCAPSVVPAPAPTTTVTGDRCRGLRSVGAYSSHLRTCDTQREMEIFGNRAEEAPVWLRCSGPMWMTLAVRSERRSPYQRGLQQEAVAYLATDKPGRSMAAHAAVNDDSIRPEGEMAGIGLRLDTTWGPGLSHNRRCRTPCKSNFAIF